MRSRPQILVVAHNATVANTLVSWLDAANYEPVLATTFAVAKMRLASHPDLVVTELKLQDYNGLHLALRARHHGIRSIILGPQDAVLERDAADMGARYLSAVLKRTELLNVVATSLRDTTCTPQCLAPVFMPGPPGSTVWPGSVRADGAMN